MSLELSGDLKFPCPVCTAARDVRITKKKKPYLVCDSCGIQIFFRGPAGIQELLRIIERGERDGLSDRLAEMHRRYRLTCPECGSKFWAERKIVKTSGFDGSFKGFRCPQKGCGAIVPWEEKE